MADPDETETSEATPQTLTGVLAAMLESGATDEDLRKFLAAEAGDARASKADADMDAAAALDGMRSGMDGIRSLFAELVPPTNITLTDSLGNEYQVGATCPAAAQIKLMREMEAVLGAEANAKQFTATSGDGSWKEVLHAVSQAMANPDVLAGLSACFKASRPRTFVHAKRAWIAEFEDIREDADLPADDALTAADLFPLEEIAAGLIPFFVRFAHRTVGLVTSLIPEPTAKT